MGAPANASPVFGKHRAVRKKLSAYSFRYSSLVWYSSSDSIDSRDHVREAPESVLD